jgi:hypothetical protein
MSNKLLYASHPCVYALNASDLKLKNQQLRETQEELHDVKQVAVREPSLRICVKRIGLTVTMDQLKVTDLIFCFLPSNLFYLI